MRTRSASAIGRLKLGRPSRGIICILYTVCDGGRARQPGLTAIPFSASEPVEHMLKPGGRRARHLQDGQPEPPPIVDEDLAQLVVDGLSPGGIRGIRDTAGIG